MEAVCKVQITVKDYKGVVMEDIVNNVSRQLFEDKGQLNKMILDFLFQQHPELSGVYHTSDFKYGTSHNQCNVQGVVYVSACSPDFSDAESCIGATLKPSAVEAIANSIAQLERISINSMSFIPSPEQCVHLSQKAGQVKDQLAHVPPVRDGNLSKFADEAFSVGALLCPDPPDVDTTVLVKFGRMAPLRNRSFAVMSDQTAPLVTGENIQTPSNGPNGVLLECQKSPYGPNRVNLFDRDPAKVHKLMADYVAFRTQSLDAVFKLYVDGFRTCVEDGYRAVKNKDIYLNEQLRAAYTHVYELMRVIQENLDFKQIFGVNSYCQTWLRNGHPVGAPMFSVMSPHFQTRFYVKYPYALAEVVGQHGITEQHLQSYREILELFTRQMQAEYGGPKGQAFVNIDGLLRAMSNH